MRLISLIFMLLVCNSDILAQETPVRIAQIDSLINEEAYGLALPKLLKALVFFPDNPEFNLKTAFCYLHSRSEKEQALPYLHKTETAFDSSRTLNSPQSVRLWANHFDSLGEGYQSLGKAEQAMKCYRFAMKLGNESPTENAALLNKLLLKTEINRDIPTITVVPSRKKETGRNKSSKKINSLLVQNETKPVNKSSAPGAASLSKTFFEKQTIGSSHSDAFLSSYDSASYTGPEEATIAASVDGQIILLYRQENHIANIYSTDLLGNSWTIPQKFSKARNTAGWEENECISADGSVMYFTSNRAGGMGGSDIYMCSREPSGEWGPARNLGAPVNTPANETAPFIYADNKTLFFSSDLHQKKENYRIYSSAFDSLRWSNPVNIGYPKSLKSEFEFSASVEKSAPLPENQIKKPKNENFLITFFDHRTTPLTVLKGRIYAAGEKLIPNVKITVIDNETGNVSAVYTSTNGHYEFILPSGKNNNITYEAAGYVFHSENANLGPLGNHYEIDKPVEMVSAAKGSQISLNNIFFAGGGAALSPLSMPETEKLVEFLRVYPSVGLQFFYTSGSEESDRVNQVLNTARAQSVITRLEEKGIDPSRLSLQTPEKPHKKHRRHRRRKSASTESILNQGLYVRLQ